MAIWTWFIGTKVGRWIVGLVLVIAGLVAALFVAFLKGKHSQVKTDDATAAQAQVDTVQASLDAANHSADAVKVTHEEVSKMPDAGIQRVGDAAAGTAAGWLHDHANRDAHNP